MYESPIEMIYGQIQSRVAEDLDNHIYKAVRNVGINVDKEELIRALNYDRDQYQKGFEDGYRKKEEELLGENDVN